MASRTGSPTSKHVLLTGAAGFVGGICRETWGHHYRRALSPTPRSPTPLTG